MIKSIECVKNEIWHKDIFLLLAPVALTKPLHVRVNYPKVQPDLINQAEPDINAVCNEREWQIIYNRTLSDTRYKDHVSFSYL